MPSGDDEAAAQLHRLGSLRQERAQHHEDLGCLAADGGPHEIADTHLACRLARAVRHGDEAAAVEAAAGRIVQVGERRVVDRGSHRAATAAGRFRWRGSGGCLRRLVERGAEVRGRKRLNGLEARAAVELQAWVLVVRADAQLVCAREAHDVRVAPDLVEAPVRHGERYLVLNVL